MCTHKWGAVWKELSTEKFWNQLLYNRTVKTKVVLHLLGFSESYSWECAAYSLSINNDQFNLLHNGEMGIPSWPSHWGLFYFQTCRKETVFDHQEMY